jgi:hypothetical protein
MIPVVFNGNPVFLLDDKPNWSQAFKVAATLPAAYERGLTGRETRRPMGDTLRLVCAFTCHLSSLPAITNLRNSLQALNAQPVLCPFWAAGFVPFTMPVVTAAYYVLFNDDDSFNSIQPAAALPFALEAYPLMVGFLSKIPDPPLPSAGVAEVAYEFSDSDNYPLAFPAFAAPNGLNAAGGMRPLFPFLPDWSMLPQSGGTESDITRKPIGALRTLAAAYYTQRGRRKVQQYFTLANADAFNLLSFFSSMGGEQNNFWLGAALNEANLVANLTATHNSMTVDNGANLGTNAFILLGDGVNRVPLAVQSVAGNVWNLAAPSGTAFKAGLTTIESLVLARFDLLKLSLNFINPNLATTQISFKELPWETNAVAGEVYGTTMGALPVTASFFKFTQTTPGGTTTWYFTSYERTLSDSVNNWLSAPMEYDNIIETADLKRNSVTLSSRNFTGNPLALLFPLSLEFPLMLQIFEGDVTPATSTVANLGAYFYGEVGDADLEAPFIIPDCKTLSHLFDRQIPRRLFQQPDNWCLFEPANGLRPEDWQWNGQFYSYDPARNTLVVGNVASTNPLPVVAHWFACGYMVVTSAKTGAVQIRRIADSNALIPIGNLVTIYLAEPFASPPAVYDVVNLFAGYDGQASTAASKFDNYQKGYGGFPFIPVGNPSVLQITQPTGGGKK